MYKYKYYYLDDTTIECNSIEDLVDLPHNSLSRNFDRTKILHREDGPAVESLDDKSESMYFICGIRISLSDFILITHKELSISDVVLQALDNEEENRKRAESILGDIEGKDTVTIEDFKKYYKEKFESQSSILISNWDYNDELKIKELEDDRRRMRMTPSRYTSKIKRIHEEGNTQREFKLTVEEDLSLSKGCTSIEEFSTLKEYIIKEKKLDYLRFLAPTSD